MNRIYVAKCRYPNREWFTLGNVVADARLKEHEIEDLFMDLWAKLSPHPFPEFHNFIPGALFFEEE